MSRHYHFIGIGGIGMSSIAQLLLKQGERVSGSDIKTSDIILSLINQGAKINIGHAASNIENPDVVVYTSAVRPDNVELRCAQERGIPVLKRAQMLSRLTDGKTCIAVAGSHGKTTTTSLVSFMLTEAKLDPTVSIGGLISNFDKNAWLGEGAYFITEADESDGSFLFLSPHYSIITNIDFEHVDYYHSWDNIKEAYKKFISNTDTGGCVFINGDDSILTQIIRETQKRYISFGLTSNSDVYARDIQDNAHCSTFVCMHKTAKKGLITINIPGRHNILNALAAISLGIELEIDFNTIKDSIYKYKGVRRRFQVKVKKDNVMVIDDYGHHPAEIKATLEAARTVGNKRLVVVFQPHRYTRTKYLLDSFAQSLAPSDYLIITDIYAAGEDPIPDIKAENLYNRIRELGHKNVFFCPKEKITEHLLGVVRSGDLVLTLGAGDIYKISDELAQRL
jgi:UDP-N-acetylmuramate--alanine ligase